jgi:hypothetical protein
MRILSSIFSIPKKGNNAKENEDSFYPIEAEINRDHLSIAIADGASEGFLSKLWSKILTISYVSWDQSELDIHRFTDFCIDIYNHQKEKYIREREENNNPLKWFEENLMIKGSFSTLLGVSFVNESPKGGYWKSYSMGDSCLFQIRESLVEIFPILDSLDFGNSPDLLSSNPIYNQDIDNKIREKTGDFLFGDTFYFMTDAIASWFLTQIEKEKNPWVILDEFFEANNNGLVEYINQLREENSVKNDDITIARVKLMEG